MYITLSVNTTVDVSPYDIVALLRAAKNKDGDAMKDTIDVVDFDFDFDFADGGADGE